MLRIYEEHRDPVFRWALRYLSGDSAQAEDVTHDVFLRLLENIERLSDDDEMGRWLYRVTVRTCLSRLQRGRLRRSLLERFGWGFRRTPPRAESRLVLADVLTALEGLPPPQRIAFSMLHLDGLEQREIAEALGFSKGYVSKLIRKATESLRSAGWELP